MGSIFYIRPWVYIICSAGVDLRAIHGGDGFVWCWLWFGSLRRDEMATLA